MFTSAKDNYLKNLHTSILGSLTHPRITNQAISHIQALKEDLLTQKLFTPVRGGFLFQ